MGHLMPGHVLSLTGEAVAYESKCALKISFSSRDADKEPRLVPRTKEYLTRHLSTLSYLGRFFLPLTFSLPFFLFFPSFLPFHHSEPINGLYPRRAMPEEFLYIDEREESRKHKRLDSLRESHVDARAPPVHSKNTRL